MRGLCDNTSSSPQQQGRKSQLIKQIVRNNTVGDLPRNSIKGGEEGRFTKGHRQRASEIVGRVHGPGGRAGCGALGGRVG